MSVLGPGLGLHVRVSRPALDLLSFRSLRFALSFALSKLRGRVWGLPLLVGLAAGAVASVEVGGWAETQISGEIGFRDRFVADRYVPVRLRVVHDGPPFTGMLVVSQTVEIPLRGRRTIEVRRPVRLGPGARPRYEFYLPLSPLPVAEGRGPELQVELIGPEGLRARTVLPLGDRTRFFPETLLLGEGSYPRLLPTGETGIELREEELPGDWRAYDGVRRIYLGRISLGQLLPEQKEALEKWLVSGGELVVLGGENFWMQDDPWLRRLLPLRVRGVEWVADLERTAIVGRPRGEVLYRVGEYPVVLRGRWGLGHVYLATLDLRDAGPIEQAAWQALQPPPPEEARERSVASDLGIELFQKKRVLLPGALTLGGILLAYLGGLAGLAMIVLRRPRWLVGLSRWEEAEVATTASPIERSGRGGGGWVGLLLAGWVLWIGLVLGLYLRQPAFTRSTQALEIGYVFSQSGSGWGVQEAWYSALRRRSAPLAVLRGEAALLYPVEAPRPPGRADPLALPVRLSLQRGPEGGLLARWTLPVREEGRPVRLLAGLYVREVLPLDVRVRFSPSGEARVYNATPWTLRRTTIYRGETRYAFGDVPPGGLREAKPSPSRDPVLPPPRQEAEGFFASVKTRLYEEALRRYPEVLGPEADVPWTLQAWVEEEGPTSPWEYRETRFLVLVFPPDGEGEEDADLEGSPGGRS